MCPMTLFNNAVQNFMRGMALCVVVLFTTTTLAWSAPLESLELFQPKEESLRSFPLDHLNISEKLGKVEDVYLPLNADKDTPLVIYIQDAHAHLEAQQNIKSLLKYFLDKHDIGHVGLESADSKIDPSILNLYPNQEWNLKIADSLLKQGMLSGAEAWAIAEPKKVNAFGVEDRDLYIQNLRDFRNVLKLKPQSDQFLGDVQSYLNLVKGRVIVGDLKKFVDRKSAHDNQRINLLTYVNDLLQWSFDVLKTDLSDPKQQKSYPNFVRIFSLKELEARLDFKEVKRESDEVASLLNRFRASNVNLVQLLLKEFKALQKNNQFQPSLDSLLHQDPRLVFELLFDFALKNNFSVSDKKALMGFAQYLIAKKEMVSSQLFNEIETVERLLMDVLVSNEDQRQWIDLFFQTELTQRVLSLEAVRTDVENFSSLNLTPQSLLSELNALKVKRNLKKEIENKSDLEQVEKVFGLAKAFYSGAKERDKAFVSNLSSKMKKDNIKKSVLISGGFHTEGIKEELKKSQMGYVVVVPQMTQKFTRDRYLNLILGNTPFLDRLLQLEDVSSTSSNILNTVSVPAMQFIDVARILSPSYLDVDKPNFQGEAVLGAMIRSFPQFISSVSRREAVSVLSQLNASVLALRGKGLLPQSISDLNFLSIEASEKGVQGRFSIVANRELYIFNAWVDPKTSEVQIRLESRQTLELGVSLASSLGANSILEKQDALVIGEALHTVLDAGGDSGLKKRFTQGGYEQEGYGVPEGAVNDGSHAMGDEGNEGYYVNGGKEIFLGVVKMMREFFANRNKKLSAVDPDKKIRLIIKTGIGGQHTPFEGIATMFGQLKDPSEKESIIVGEYELGKNFEVSIESQLAQLGADWEEVALIPSSKSGSTDETMMVFESIFKVLLKKVAEKKALDGVSFSNLVFNTLNEINVNKEGVEQKKLFTINKDWFLTSSFVELLALKAKDKGLEISQENIKDVLGTVLGNMFFETVDTPEKSRLSAFIRNSGLKEELGENAPGFGAMFNNVGGRWTADLHMMTFLSYYDLDSKRYWEVRKAGIEKVRGGTHIGNRLAHHVLDGGYKDIALVVPDEAFWFGKAIEQNFNESIWQAGFANLVAVRQSDWGAQKKNYFQDDKRLVVTLGNFEVSSADYNVFQIPSEPFENHSLLQAVNQSSLVPERKLRLIRQYTAEKLGEWFTTFYGMTYTAGTRLIARDIRSQGLDPNFVDVSDLDNPITRILQENLYLRQPFVELGKGILKTELEALQEEERGNPGAVKRRYDEVSKKAVIRELLGGVPGYERRVQRIFDDTALSLLLSQAKIFTEKDGRKIIPFIYLEGDRFYSLRDALINMGMEWVMQGTGDQHISYQQVLSQPQKYFPIIISFVPKQPLEANPAIGFAKSYLHGLPSHLVRDAFAEASYKALAELRKDQGGAGLFIRLDDSRANINLLLEGFGEIFSRNKQIEEAGKQEKKALFIPYLDLSIPDDTDSYLVRRRGSSAIQTLQNLKGRLVEKPVLSEVITQLAYMSGPYTVNNHNIADSDKIKGYLEALRTVVIEKKEALKSEIESLPLFDPSALKSVLGKGGLFLIHPKTNGEGDLQLVYVSQNGSASIYADVLNRASAQYEWKGGAQGTLDRFQQQGYRVLISTEDQTVLSLAFDIKDNPEKYKTEASSLGILELTGGLTGITGLSAFNKRLKNKPILLEVVLRLALIYLENKVEKFGDTNNGLTDQVALILKYLSGKEKEFKSEIKKLPVYEEAGIAKEDYPIALLSPKEPMEVDGAVAYSGAVGGVPLFRIGEKVEMDALPSLETNRLLFTSTEWAEIKGYIEIFTEEPGERQSLLAALEGEDASSEASSLGVIENPKTVQYLAERFYLTDKNLFSEPLKESDFEELASRGLDEKDLINQLIQIQAEKRKAEISLSSIPGAPESLVERLKDSPYLEKLVRILAAAYDGTQAVTSARIRDPQADRLLQAQTFLEAKSSKVINELVALDMYDPVRHGIGYITLMTPQLLRDNHFVEVDIKNVQYLDVKASLEDQKRRIKNHKFSFSRWFRPKDGFIPNEAFNIYQWIERKQYRFLFNQEEITEFAKAYAAHRAQQAIDAKKQVGSSLGEKEEVINKVREGLASLEKGEVPVIIGDVSLLVNMLHGKLKDIFPAPGGGVIGTNTSIGTGIYIESIILTLEKEAGDVVLKFEFTKQADKRTREIKLYWNGQNYERRASSLGEKVTDLETIRALADEYDLITENPFSAHASDGDLAWWATQALTEDELIKEFQFRLTIRTLAAETGYRVVGQSGVMTTGDLSWWAEQLRDGHKTEEEIAKEFRYKAAMVISEPSKDMQVLSFEDIREGRVAFDKHQKLIPLAVNFFRLYGGSKEEYKDIRKYGDVLEGVTVAVGKTEDMYYDFDFETKTLLLNQQFVDFLLETGRKKIAMSWLAMIAGHIEQGEELGAGERKVLGILLIGGQQSLTRQHSTRLRDTKEIFDIKENVKLNDTKEVSDRYFLNQNDILLIISDFMHRGRILDAPRLYQMLRNEYGFYATRDFNVEELEVLLDAFHNQHEDKIDRREVITKEDVEDLRKKLADTTEVSLQDIEDKTTTTARYSFKTEYVADPAFKDRIIVWDVEVERQDEVNFGGKTAHTGELMYTPRAVTLANFATGSQGFKQLLEHNTTDVISDSLIQNITQLQNLLKKYKKFTRLSVEQFLDKVENGDEEAIILREELQALRVTFRKLDDKKKKQPLSKMIQEVIGVLSEVILDIQDYYPAKGHKIDGITDYFAFLGKSLDQRVVEIKEKIKSNETEVSIVKSRISELKKDIEILNYINHRPELFLEDVQTVVPLAIDLLRAYRDDNTLYENIRDFFKNRTDKQLFQIKWGETEDELVDHDEATNTFVFNQAFIESVILVNSIKIVGNNLKIARKQSEIEASQKTIQRLEEEAKEYSEQRHDLTQRNSNKFLYTARNLVVPPKVEEEIKKNLMILAERLKISLDKLVLAIRSSAVGEDSEEASFAGMQDTSIFVTATSPEWVQKVNANGVVRMDETGVDNFITEWVFNQASLFNNRAIDYRFLEGLPTFDDSVEISTLFQRMFLSKLSFVAMTADKQTGYPSISSNIHEGQGEKIVSGDESGSKFILSLDGQAVIIRQKGERRYKIVETEDRMGKVELPLTEEEKREFSVTDQRLLGQYAELLSEIDRFYGQGYVDLEGAFRPKEESKGTSIKLVGEDGEILKDERGFDRYDWNVVSTQARPETVISLQDPDVIKLKRVVVTDQAFKKAELEGNVLDFTFIAKTGGTAQGEVAWVLDKTDPAELAKAKGKILATFQSDPDMNRAMLEAKGVIAILGGQNSHTMIVASEYGLVAVTGTSDQLMTVLKEGMQITVDAERGKILLGYDHKVKIAGNDFSVRDIPNTPYGSTRSASIVASPEKSLASYATRNIPSYEGVGLKRLEIDLANIGIYTDALLAYDNMVAQEKGELEEGVASKYILNRKENVKLIQFIEEQIAGYNSGQHFYQSIITQGILATAEPLNPDFVEVAYRYQQIQDKQLRLAVKDIVEQMYEVGLGHSSDPLLTSLKILKEAQDDPNVRVLIEEIIGLLDKHLKIRLDDRKSDEYKAVKGSELFVKEELNAMKGYRGLELLLDSPTMEWQLEAMIRVAMLKRHKIGIFAPIVRRPSDLKQMIERFLKVGENLGISNVELANLVQIGMMTEIPTNAININDFLAVVQSFRDAGIPIRFFTSTGGNDALQTIYRIDRNTGDPSLKNNATAYGPAVIRWNAMVTGQAKIFNESAIKEAKAALKEGDRDKAYLILSSIVKCGYCGNDPSVPGQEEYGKGLAALGYSSVSVVIEAFEKVAKNLAAENISDLGGASTQEKYALFEDAAGFTFNIDSEAQPTVDASLRMDIGDILLNDMKVHPWLLRDLSQDKLNVEKSRETLDEELDTLVIEIDSLDRRINVLREELSTLIKRKEAVSRSESVDQIEEQINEEKRTLAEMTVKKQALVVKRDDAMDDVEKLVLTASAGGVLTSLGLSLEEGMLHYKNVMRSALHKAFTDARSRNLSLVIGTDDAPTSTEVGEDEEGNTLKTGGMRGLIGGLRYEPFEANPDFGVKGIVKSLNRDLEFFKIQLSIIKQLSEEFSDVEFSIALKLVRIYSDIDKVIELLDEAGLSDVKLGLDIQSISNLMELSEILQTERRISFLSIQDVAEVTSEMMTQEVENVNGRIISDEDIQYQTERPIRIAATAAAKKGIPFVIPAEELAKTKFVEASSLGVVSVEKVNLFDTDLYSYGLSYYEDGLFPDFFKLFGSDVNGAAKEQGLHFFVGYSSDGKGKDIVSSVFLIAPTSNKLGLRIVDTLSRGAFKPLMGENFEPSVVMGDKLISFNLPKTMSRSELIEFIEKVARTPWYLLEGTKPVDEKDESVISAESLGVEESILSILNNKLGAVVEYPYGLTLEGVVEATTHAAGKLIRPELSDKQFEYMYKQIFGLENEVIKALRGLEGYLGDNKDSLFASLFGTSQPQLGVTVRQASVTSPQEVVTSLLSNEGNIAVVVLDSPEANVEAFGDALNQLKFSDKDKQALGQRLVLVHVVDDSVKSTIKLITQNSEFKDVSGKSLKLSRLVDALKSSIDLEVSSQNIGKHLVVLAEKSNLEDAAFLNGTQLISVDRSRLSDSQWTTYQLFAGSVAAKLAVAGGYDKLAADIKIALKRGAANNVFTFNDQFVQLMQSLWTEFQGYIRTAQAA